MRGLRDGLPVDFDQADPPADGGRPSTEALIVADDGEDEQVLCRLDGLTIAREPREAGAPRSASAHCQWLYPLDDARVLRLSIPDR